MWFLGCVKQDTKLCIIEKRVKKVAHLRLTYLLQTACALKVLYNTSFCKESLSNVFIGWADVHHALYIQGVSIR